MAIVHPNLLLATVAFVFGLLIPTGVQADAKQVFYGDLHVHTSYSSDAYVLGAFVDPDLAYRFAKGLPIESPTGETINLQDPLDFMAVTDHSEWLGEIGAAMDTAHLLHEHVFARRLREAWRSGEEGQMMLYDVIFPIEVAGRRPTFSGAGGRHVESAAKTLWGKTIAAAERHNKPGEFTTFVAFEWTASPAYGNLHRNVFFRGNDVPQLPVSFFEARTVEKLWEWMQESGGGTDNVLAITHNANVSNGLMFKPVGAEGEPYTASQAGIRRQLEPLVEITQIKGTSESHPVLAVTDEFIGFELLPDTFSWADIPLPHSRYNWAREGLKIGMEEAQRIGVNPLQYGFVGATDNHSGLGGDVNERDTYQTVGKRGKVPVPLMPGRNPGGLTAVWARENTRDSIWEGLKNRETFATSGTRIRLSLFAGWDLSKHLLGQRDWRRQAYRLGVPMGQVLSLHQKGDSVANGPDFVIQASAASGGAGLERIQVIKLWTERENSHERIYDVACAGGASIDSIGNRCSFSDREAEDIECSELPNRGARQLQTLWRDPEFRPDVHAAYYVRVLEVPTCRWSTWEALHRDIPLPKDLPVTVRERAWSSPIWYSP